MDLKVFDKGSQFSTAKIIVNVKDINDHEPHFINGSTTIDLLESCEPGYSVYQVKAVDEDIGANGAITYKYSPLVSQTARRIFSLDETDGWIRKRFR